MTDYKTIRGKKIKFFTSDLSNTEAEGQIFYVNTSPGSVDTSGTFKTVVASAAWHSTGPLTYDRGFLASSGTQTASWVAGGFDTDSPANYYQSTEEYNGVGWSNGGNLPAGIYGAGAAGTQTAGLIFGGSDPTASPNRQSATATYNGTSWSATPNSMNTARDQVAGGGIQSSALVVGGRTSAAMLTNMEEWNGTSWSNLTALSQARGYTQANGPETAFFIASGATGNNGGTPMTSLTEEYDGSSLSSGANVNTARSAGGAAGDSSAGLFFGGWTGASPGLALNCETYDGTSWTETADLATHKRGTGSGAGTSNTAAIAAGSYGPPSTTTSEEFNVTANTVTGAAFASGGDTNIYSFGRNWANMGTQNATYMNGGYTYTNNTEEYNGSSWSESGDTSNGRYFGTGAGTQTAGLAFGGYLTTGATNVTEEYNGSSWTSGGNMNVSSGSRMGGGPQTAAIGCGGTGPITATEYYDGSSWATQPATLNETHRERNGVGTQSSYVAMGGTNPGETVFHTDVEEYNGSAWTSVAELVVESKNAAGIIGNSASGAIYCGGQNSNPATNVDGSQVFNGTTVFTGVSPAFVARSGNQGAGTTSSGLISGRYNPADNKTEEFTGETTALNLKTITDS